MHQHRPILLVSAVLLLAIGCSKSGSKSGADAGVDARPSDANLPKDARTPDASKTLDAPRPVDVKEVGGIVDAAKDSFEAGTKDAASDAKDAFGDGKSSDALEVFSIGDALRDVGADARFDSGKRDGANATDADSGTGTDVPIVGLGTCQSPIDLPFDLNSADIEVDTTGALHVTDIPCATNGSTLVFRIKVDTRRKLYYAHTFGADWNTALMFSESCTAPKLPNGQELTACSDDACGTPQSAVSALLTYGYRYLFLTGVGEATGKVTLHFEQAMVGTGKAMAMPEGEGVIDGALTGMETVAWCEAVGPKNAFWWVGCPAYAGGVFNATTCGGTTVDTVLSLQIPRAQMAMCMDDDIECGSQSTISTPIPAGAGLNVLTVMGALGTSTGEYKLTYLRP